jgi:hypothetical protein
LEQDIQSFANSFAVPFLKSWNEATANFDETFKASGILLLQSMKKESFNSTAVFLSNLVVSVLKEQDFSFADVDAYRYSSEKPGK